MDDPSRTDDGLKDESLGGVDGAPREPSGDSTSEQASLPNDSSLFNSSILREASLSESGDAARPVVHLTGVAASDREIGADDPTIISNRSPLSAPSGSILRPTDLARSLEGEQLGNFRLEQFVGGGGMGAVFRAADLELGRTVAVKVVPCDHSDVDTLQRFKNEAKNAARLDHPHIARVFNVGVDKGWHYIVFEFIEGVNIRDLVLQRGALSLADAIHYTRQVTLALGHAWAREVVHRDIKPSNVLVMEDGTVKLVDMGLARLHHVESSADDLTNSGMTLGTFDYISPEQARDPRDTDVRSDLYSLGCTLFFMLTARAPFPDGTVLQKLLRHSSEAAPDILKIRPELPEAMGSIVSCLLSKSPADRFQSAGELIQALDELARAEGIAVSAFSAATAPLPETEVKSGWQRHLAWGVPLLLLCAVLWVVENGGRASGARWVMSRPRLGQPVPNTASSPKLDAAKKPAAVIEAPATAETIVGAAADATAPPEASADPGAGEKPGEAGAGGDASLPGAPSRPRDATPPSKPSAVPASAEANSAPLTPAAPAGQPVELSSFPATDGSVSGGVSPTSPEQRLPVETEVEGALAPPPLSGGVSAADAVTEDRTVIAVAQSAAQAPPGGLVVDSLAAAFDLARDASETREIVLHFDGVTECSPLQLELADDRSLTIRAAEGRQPVLRFQPSAPESQAARRMISVTGGELSFTGVQLELKMPVDNYTGWALFYLKSRSRLALTDCALTIFNQTERGEPQYRVAFIELQGRAQAGMMPPGGAVDLPAVVGGNSSTITLNRCLARGEAAMVRADVVDSFNLFWTDGFFASSQRMLEAGGIGQRGGTKMRNKNIGLHLTRVTAIVEKSLWLVAPEVGQSVPNLDFILNSCVIGGRAKAPLLEHDSLDLPEGVEATVQLVSSDNNNRLEESQLIWQKMPESVVLMGVGVAGPPAWAKDQEGRRMLPAHQQLPTWHLLADGDVSGCPRPLAESFAALLRDTSK